MVCDKCEKKLNRVICPEVAKKPLHKQSEHIATNKPEEESKKPIPLYKRKLQQQEQSEVVDFKGVTTSELVQTSLSNSTS